MGHLKDRPHRRRWGTAVLAAGLVGGTAWQAAAAQPMVGLPDFTPIIQHYGAAVVNISSTSTKTVHGAMPTNPVPPNSPFSSWITIPGAMPALSAGPGSTVKTTTP